MADVVKAPFDVTLQYPLRGKAAAKCREYVFTSILRTAPFAETERLRVCCCLRHQVEGQGIERLHGPVIHTGNTQRTFLFLARFLNIHPAERFSLVAFVCQTERTAHFRGGTFPELLVHARRVFALVRGHLPDSQHFSVVRMN